MPPINVCTVSFITFGNKLLKVGIVDWQLDHQEGAGSTLRKIESHPPVLDLVVGVYGEPLDGVKRLLDKLAESQVNSLGLRRRQTGSSQRVEPCQRLSEKRLTLAIMCLNVNCFVREHPLFGLLYGLFGPGWQEEAVAKEGGVGRPKKNFFCFLLPS